MTARGNAWRHPFFTAGIVTFLLAGGLADAQQPAPAKKPPVAAAPTESPTPASAIRILLDNGLIHELRALPARQG